MLPAGLFSLVFLRIFFVLQISQEKTEFKLLRPASAPPSPSSTRASTPRASDDDEDDDTHLYDDDEEENPPIQFKATDPRGGNCGQHKKAVKGREASDRKLIPQISSRVW